MPREKSEAFADSGSQPKRVTWYETGHFFEDDGARRERMAWLREQLKE